MNSTYTCNKDDLSCKTTKIYQYGVYTYMYVDLPVISSFIKIPYFAKTKKMFEFRNYAGAAKLKKSGKSDYFAYDLNDVPNTAIEMYDYLSSSTGESVLEDGDVLNELLDEYNSEDAKAKIGYYGVYQFMYEYTRDKSDSTISLFDNSARSRMQYQVMQKSLTDSSGGVLQNAKDRSCGVAYDYSDK